MTEHPEVRIDRQINHLNAERAPLPPLDGEEAELLAVARGIKRLRDGPEENAIDPGAGNPTWLEGHLRHYTSVAAAVAIVFAMTSLLPLFMAASPPDDLLHPIIFVTADPAEPMPDSPYHREDFDSYPIRFKAPDQLNGIVWDEIGSVVVHRGVLDELGREWFVDHFQAGRLIGVFDMKATPFLEFLAPLPSVLDQWLGSSEPGWLEETEPWMFPYAAFVVSPDGRCRSSNAFVFRPDLDRPGFVAGYVVGVYNNQCFDPTLSDE